MKLVPLKKVKLNSTVAKTLYDSEGRVLLTVGSKLTDSLIRKLDLLNINFLYVSDYEDDLIIKSAIKSDIRDKLLTLIKSTFISLNSSTNNYDTVDNNLKKMYELAEDILDNIFENIYLSSFVIDIKNDRPTLFNHSINVAVISLLIGFYLDYNREELINLCVGALLHDIGKSLIDIDLINKETPLTYEEFEIVKGHCEKGYYYLYENDYIHSDVKQIILQHHERVDGLGYPKGLIGNQINKMAKIVSVANTYDTLTSDNPYMDSMPSSDAIEYIMSHVNSSFDFDIVNIFSKIIVPFPNGTRVKLSNGDIAIVKETFKDFPLRPNVKIIQSKIKENEGKVIRLLDELSIVIKDFDKIKM